jgi:hypothetical protein
VRGREGHNVRRIKKLRVEVKGLGKKKKVKSTFGPLTKGGVFILASNSF